MVALDSCNPIVVEQGIGTFLVVVYGALCYFDLAPFAFRHVRCA